MCVRYFFRNEKLRHLRIEQFTRYFFLAGETEFAAFTKENTQADPEEDFSEDGSHRNYDRVSSQIPENSHYLAAFKAVPGCKKRNSHRLGVSRVPFLECIGAQRENFYEMKLVLGLPWHCSSLPEMGDDGKQEWIFRVDFDPEDFGNEMQPLVLKLGREDVSFEMICNTIETKFCDHHLGLVCACCTEELPESPCPSCQYSLGFHYCKNYATKVWRKGTLHAGVLDVQRVLFNLHRKSVPIEKMRERAQAYVDADLITQDVAHRIMAVILSERNHEEYLNEAGDGPPEENNNLSTKLTHEQMQRLLEEREEMMRASPDGQVTDQWRVYEHVINCIQNGDYLRLMIQASAGTGKLEP